MGVGGERASVRCAHEASRPDHRRCCLCWLATKTGAAGDIAGHDRKAAAIESFTRPAPNVYGIWASGQRVIPQSHAAIKFGPMQVKLRLVPIVLVSELLGIFQRIRASPAASIDVAVNPIAALVQDGDAHRGFLSGWRVHDGNR